MLIGLTLSSVAYTILKENINKKLEKKEIEIM
jgi:hypothetical protein